MRYGLTITVLALTAFAAAAEGQQAVHPGYPNVDKRVEIAPGETVHLLNRILVDRAPGLRAVRRMDFQYRTAIPAGDAAAREAQAARAAEYLGPVALEAGAHTMAIAICDSDACGRRAEPPKVWYLYELRANAWKPLRN